MSSASDWEKDLDFPRAVGLSYELPKTTFGFSTALWRLDSGWTGYEFEGRAQKDISSVYFRIPPMFPGDFNRGIEYAVVESSERADRRYMKMVSLCLQVAPLPDTIEEGVRLLQAYRDLTRYTGPSRPVVNFLGDTYISHTVQGEEVYYSRNFEVRTQEQLVDIISNSKIYTENQQKSRESLKQIRGGL